MFQIIFLIWLMFAPITSSAEGDKCNHEGNQLEMNACAHDDFLKADKELNQTYQAVMKNNAADKVFINKLRVAQKAWLAFRDAELEARFPCAEQDVRVCWGTMYPLLFLTSKTELTRERTKQLQYIDKNNSPDKL